MKKTIKLPIIITSSILAALIIAIIILCVVPVQPFKPFSNYDRVEIMTTTTTNLGDLTAESNKDRKSEFDKAIKNANYSVMHSLLEFNVKYSPLFVYKTEKNDKGKEVVAKDASGNKIKKEMTYAEVITACVPTETAFVVKFFFNKPQTIKVEKSQVKYDSVFMAISTTDGQIKPVTLYLVDSNLVNGVNPDVEAYRINPVTLNANTSPLYITLNSLSTLMA